MGQSSGCFLHTASCNCFIISIISSVDCLALRNEFKVNNTIEIEESDEQCLHL
jgi:hypothetical protein